MKWPITRHVEHRARQFDNLMERIHVDALKFARLDQGRAYLDARRVCIDCHHSAECLAWLGKPGEQNSGGQPSQAPAFCPNLPKLENFKQR